jgi:Fe-S cluster biogenesis protein NfuA
MEDDNSLSERVRSVVEAVLVPLIERDGGAVQFVRREGDRVVLKMGGACAGCPGRPFTLAHVVLPAIQRADPSVARIDVEPML